MRNLLALLAALVLVIAGVGWYRDWFKFHSEPAASGHRNVNIDIDTHKIGADLHQGEQKLHHLLQGSKDAGKSGKETKTGKVTPQSDAGHADTPRTASSSMPSDR
jgi:hypothetical protein